MKKYLFLGLNSHTGECCCVYSPYTFEQLNKNKNEIEVSDFNYSATDWGGRDDLTRTCECEGVNLSSREIKLLNPITVEGVDHDMGHTYPWEFTFDTLLETV